MKTTKRPNILWIVLDDMGYSDVAPYGGEMHTPHISYLAEKGLLFTHCHVSSLSAPTRSMLLTGVDNHCNGLGIMPAMHSINQYMQPGYEGYLNDTVVTLPELLRENSYHTYMTGKWHLGHPEGHRPVDRGFERSFTLMAGGASHFSNAFPLGLNPDDPTTFYVEDHQVVEKLPEGFYSTRYYTDKMLEYLHQQEDDQPFFAYLAYTAPHDPLHIPDEWRDRCKGRYDEGYGATARKRLDFYCRKGLITEKEAEEMYTYFRQEWDKLSDEKKREQSRKMEIYAAMIEYTDYQIGRLLDYLRQKNCLEDTICIFLSDNGANPKEGSFYSGHTEEEINRMFNNRPENMGRPDSFVSIGKLWAEVADIPLSYYKTTTGEGGIQVPLIISGKGVESRETYNRDLLHITDIIPTILEITGIPRSTTRKGNTLAPLYGKSLEGILCGRQDTPLRGAQDFFCIEMIEAKAVYSGDGWKARFLPNVQDTDRKWHLFYLPEDVTEQHDLSREHPEKLHELLEQWEQYAKSVGYIEANGKPALNYMTLQRFYEYYPYGTQETDS